MYIAQKLIFPGSQHTQDLQKIHFYWFLLLVEKLLNIGTRRNFRDGAIFRHFLRYTFIDNFFSCEDILSRSKAN